MVMMMLEVHRKWMLARFHDFESVTTYNVNVHQINRELRFYSSAVSDANLIDEMCFTFNPFMRILTELFYQW